MAGAVLVTVVCAVLAASCNALGSVLQRKGALRQPFHESMSVRMLGKLAHQRPWWGGIAFMLAGFGFQVAALSTGPISLVQPILAAELGFLLVLSALLLGARLHAREWTAVLGMNAGITLLLVSLQPTGGDTRHVSGPTWALGCAVTLTVIGALAALVHRYHYARRAAYLGVASGMAFGFLAVLVSGVTGAFAGGVGAVLAAWQTYAVLLVGPAAFLQLQTTLRAGSLVASQPGVTLANPVVGILWGAAVFGEEVRSDGWLGTAVAGFALIAACTVLLASSPSLRGSAGAYEDTGDRVGETGGAASAEDAEDEDEDTSPDRNHENH